MSSNTVLIVLGAILIVVGFVKMGGHQSGGFNLSNFGITIGGKSIQSNKTGNVTTKGERSSKPDWIGLAIAALGFLTSLVGWFKG